MNPLKKGFSKTLNIIKKNKKTFFLLFILQLLLIISISAVTVSYQIKITENARNVVEPLQQANYDSNLIEQGQPFMEDMAKQMASISKNYREMTNNILKMFFLILGCFLLFDGLLWSISNKLIKMSGIFHQPRTSGKFLSTKNHSSIKGGSLGKKIRTYWTRFILLTIVFIVPLILVGFFWLKSFMNLGAGTLSLGIRTLSWVFLIISYFLLIGYCLLEEKLKVIIKKMFLIGLKEIHWIMLSLLFILGAVLLDLLFIYFSIGNLLLMAVSVIILILILVVGKLFLINTVMNINQD